MSLRNRTLVAVLVLPFNVLVTVPALILWATGLDRWSYPWVTIAGAAGSLLLAAALYGAVRTMMLFTQVGKGTPGPWDPPIRLVVEGPYRHVRNPMISSVVFGLFGEGLLFCSVPILVWAGVFLLGNLTYIKRSEEPALVERFGDAYVEYRRNVPAWIPRIRPWTQATSNDEQQQP